MAHSTTCAATVNLVMNELWSVPSGLPKEKYYKASEGRDDSGFLLF